MKKNIFKFAYVALAAVAMIVIGQKEAKAESLNNCINYCEAQITACMKDCYQKTPIEISNCANNCADTTGIGLCIVGCWLFE